MIIRVLGLGALAAAFFLLENHEAAGAELVGPYRPLTRNPKIVEEVFASQGRLYMLLKDEFRGRELRIKISDAKSSQYRRWPDGREERIIAAGRGSGAPVKDANWIETKAPFIEYWMEGRLILHLMRVREVPTRPTRPTGKKGVLAGLKPEKRPSSVEPRAVEKRIAVETPMEKGTAAEVPLEKGMRHFGPCRALVMNREIVRDVRVDDKLNTYLKLNPKYRKNEIRVKISNSNKSGYREWDYGGLELVSPAEAGRPPDGWTDWIQVESKYVEYWMGGELFLHLMRTDI